jgi:hypothetical protein
MARKLKTYQTSLGFFDQAIAAIDEGGSGGVGRRQQSLPPGRGEGEPRSGRYRSDLGKARRRSQAPGWVRPIFQRTCRAARRSWRRKTDEGGPPVERLKGEKAFLSPHRQGCERKAAFDYERERRSRELERAKEEAARQKERERRQQAVDKAQAALDKAEQEHGKRAAAIQAQVEALEKRSQTEEARWDKEKERLEAALRRARA